MTREWWAHLGGFAGIFLFGISIVQGFDPDGNSAIVVAEGGLASAFWLLSALLPIYNPYAFDHPNLANCFNAIAAGATGGALMASVPDAWSVLYNGL